MTYAAMTGRASSGADNRVATEYEERSIRAHLRVLSDAHERQIEEAQAQVVATQYNLWVAQEHLADAGDNCVEAQHTYDEAYARHNQALDFLVLARTPWEDEAICRQKGLIHPVRRFPPELLSMVFVATVKATYAEATNWGIGKHVYSPVQQAPYRLAAVCRRWRDVALDTQAAWRTICVDLWNITESNATSYGDYLKTSFERCAMRDVDLHVDQRPRLAPLPFNRMVEPAALRVMTILKGLAGPDSIATLTSDVEPNVFDLFSDTPSPRLTLHEVAFGFVDSPNSQRLALLPTSAPRLHAISLSIRGFQAPIRVRYPSVRRVSLSFDGFMRDSTPLSNALLFFPNARDVFIDAMRTIYTEGHLRHDKVESLRIRGLCGFHQLAGTYSFPSLRDAHIEVVAPPEHMVSSAIEPVLHLVATGLASVRRLTLDVAMELCREAIQALKCTPLLEQLICSRCTVTDEFLTEMSRPQESAWLWPNLATLKLGRFGSEDLAEQLCFMVQERRVAHNNGDNLSPIRCLSTNFNALPFEFSESIRERLVAQGCRIDP